LGDTIQSVRQDIFNNPEAADKLIDAQYESIRGLVSSGLLQLLRAQAYTSNCSKLDLANELVAGLRMAN